MSNGEGGRPTPAGASRRPDSCWKAIARCWLLALACIACPATASTAAAQGVRLDPQKEITQFVHDVWGPKQGLPNRRVNAIAQTPDGYLWVGTAEGLARFDGVRFTVFLSSGYPEIGNDDIRSLLVDRAGSLWIGTYGGGLTQLENGKFTRYTTKQGLAHDIVYRISQVRSGALWISTGGGASRLQDGVFTNFTLEQGLAGNRVFAVFEDREGTQWIGTYGGGVSRYRDGKFTTFRAADGLGSDLVIDITDDSSGAIWISSYGGGLTRLVDGKFSRFVADNGAIPDRTKELLRDSNGSLWIATYDGGLTRLHEGRLSVFSRAQGLTDDLVNALFEDREGNLWVGTGGGLERFRRGKVTHYSTAEGLSNNRVYGVYEDAAGTVWIATEGGGLNRLRDGRFTSYTAADGLASDNTVSLAQGAGDLWIGTVDAGVSRRQGEGFANYGAAQGLKGLVFAMAEDVNGGLWIGTSDGLGHLHNGQFKVIGNNAGFVNQAVRSLRFDRNGDLWIGTNGGGLGRMSKGRFKTYTTKDGLGGDFVYSIHEDDQGTLWFGSKDGGLTRWKDGRFFGFTRPGGLNSSAVLQILEDNGELWLSNPGRLLRVSKQQLNAFADGKSDLVRTISYGESDGVRGGFNGGSQPAGWRSANGRLWFATDAGVLAVDPASMPVNRLRPPVYIEQMVAQDQRLDLIAKAPRADRVFAPGNGNFEFQYTALSLVSPERVRFKYRLEGFDIRWVDAGTRRTAYYTNLPPGQYRFQVIASNNDGVWNEQGDSFAFRLQPVFYRTAWFYALSGLVLLLGVAGLHRLHVHHLRSRAIALAATVEERTGELAAANEILQRISGIDSLTGIANRRRFDEMLSNEWQRALRQRWPLSAVMIDIDDFKAFNDGYGHQKGDECLRQIAIALQQRVARGGDFVARYGGEEFVILLPNTDPAGALAVAEQLRQHIESLTIPHPFAGASKIVTISAGVGTVHPETAQTPDELIKHADRHLYEAKRSGRNRVQGAS